MMRLAIPSVFILMALTAKINPLSFAKELAESQTYKDKKYGYGKDEIDCTRFTLAVVEKCMEVKLVTLKPADKIGITIGNLTELDKLKDDEKAKKLAELIEANDERTKGVHSVLVRLKIGEPIRIEDAMPGDIVQYWRKSGGKWFGHSGIIEIIEDTPAGKRARLFGAHESLGKIGTSRPEESLILKKNDDRRIYIVRLKE